MKDGPLKRIWKHAPPTTERTQPFAAPERGVTHVPGPTRYVGIVPGVTPRA